MNIQNIVAGNYYWANWVDTLPTYVKAIRPLNGEIIPMYVIEDRGQRVSVPVKILSEERPYISDDNFDHWWMYGLGSTSECFAWFAENVNLVDLAGVMCADDLVQAIKHARYKYHTGREWKNRADN